MIERRSLLLGLGASLVAAPAIVRASSLMPVRTMLIAPSVKHYFFISPSGKWYIFHHSMTEDEIAACGLGHARP